MAFPNFLANSGKKENAGEGMSALFYIKLTSRYTSSTF